MVRKISHAHGAVRVGNLANHVRALAQPLNRSDGTSIREEVSPCTTSTPTPAGVGVLVVHGETSSRMDVPSERFSG